MSSYWDIYLMWIRNHRATNKKSNTSMTKKRTHDGKEVTVSEIRTKASIVSDILINVDKFTESDIKNALLEMTKFVNGKNACHFKRLLLITKSTRRSWIENKATRIVDILEKYPPLGSYEMILYENVNLLNTTEQIIFENINQMIEELRILYLNEENDGTFETVEVSTEKRKSEVLQKLYDELLPKRVKNKVLYPLWTAIEVLSSTDCLSSNEGAAPRAVIFINVDDDEIHQAFILADDNVRVEVPEPTTAKILAVLLSSYYAWHRSFPTAYSNTLEFLAYKVFNIDMKCNTALAKFLRKLDNFKIKILPKTPNNS